jgi:CBS domain-containing protein
MAGQSQALGEMSFGWPVPGVVHVSEWVEKNGTKAELAYELEVCRADGGAKIHHRNVRFVTLGGIPADDERVRAQVQQAVVFSSLIPVMWVGDDGGLLGVVGLEDLIRHVLGELPAGKEREMVARFVEAPGILAVIEAKSSALWEAWVGMWRLFEPGGDEKQTFVGEVPLPGGMVERSFVTERLESPEGALRLRQVRREGNQELEASLRQVLAPLLANAPSQAEAEKMLSASRIERITSWEVLIDPTTLRPFEVETRMNMALSLPGQERKSQEEYHRYKFDWEAGASAAPQCGLSK